MMNDDRYCLDNFELYVLARTYRRRIYQLIRQLPNDEKYCLDKKMRRAAMSVSNNVAEGHGRWQYQEFIHFCRIARGSIGEIIDDLNAFLDEKWGIANDIVALKDDGYALIARINGYIAYLQKSKQGTPSKSSKKLQIK
jgi:four helix bundle protein